MSPLRSMHPTDSTTNELRARGWLPDPAVAYGCGCRAGAHGGRDGGKLCAGHAEQRAVEHYSPELVPRHSTVGGHAEIPRAVFTGPDRERAIESATAYAWRSWFGELHRSGLRPVGWPAVQQTHLAFDAFSGATGGLVEVDAERAEILMLSVTCEAVPA